MTSLLKGGGHGLYGQGFENHAAHPPPKILGSTPPPTPPRGIGLLQLHLDLIVGTLWMLEMERAGKKYK